MEAIGYHEPALPVVVGCLQDRNGIVMIEQPELHIHPAVQVGMGDLFIEVVKSPHNQLGEGKTLLVETHSEHIMLRLLRRVRETSANEIPPDGHAIAPEDIAVIYVENVQGIVAFRRMKLDQDGDFHERWPHGFFEERAEELF